MSLGDWSAVVSVLSLILMYCFSQPLKQSLNTLTNAVEKLCNKIDKTDARLDSLTERLVKVEASSASAHKRLDDLKNLKRGE